MLREKGLKTAVATATDEPRTRKYLSEIGILHLFDRICCATMVENGIRMRLIGDKSRFSKSLLGVIEHSEELTSDKEDMLLQIALNYGGRDELVRAAKKIASLVAEGTISPSDITEKLISDNLDTKGAMDCDLIIRTGGEKRTSNFLMWQGAYSELYFSDVLWPDFDEDEFDRAMQFFSQRQRRFGGIK